MKLHRQAHAVYKAQYHIVWVTRFRRKILIKGVAAYLNIKLEEVRAHYPDWYYIEKKSDLDHVHIQITFPPRYSGSFVVETLKKNTSRALRSHFPFLDKVYWDKGGIWARGYFFSTVGINEEIIQRYIQIQGAEDAGQAELEL